MEISDIIPPNPGPIALIGNPMDTELPEILINHILPLIPFSKILLWIWSTIPPTVYALRPALTRKSESHGTIPSYIMRSEQSVAAPLENLSMALEILDEIHLFVAASAAFVVAVGPELVLDSVIRMRHRFSPIESDEDFFLLGVFEGFLQGIAEGFVDESGGNEDFLDVAVGVGAFLRRIHGYERLVDAVCD